MTGILSFSDFLLPEKWVLWTYSQYKKWKLLRRVWTTVLEPIRAKRQHARMSTLLINNECKHLAKEGQVAGRCLQYNASYKPSNADVIHFPTCHFWTNTLGTEEARFQASSRIYITSGSRTIVRFPSLYTCVFSDECQTIPGYQCSFSRPSPRMRPALPTLGEEILW